MTRRSRLPIGLIGLALLAGGCADAPSPPPAPAEAEVAGDPVAQEGATAAGTAIGEDLKPGILEGVLKLVRDSANKAGGDHFNIATENLNHYFQDAPTSDFALSEATKAFLATQSLPPNLGEAISERQFRRNDGRHIEDNLIYHAIATRVAGEGDDLTRAARVFDWIVRNTTLVPNRALAPPGMEQAEARPFDVILRAMATEDRAGWSERGWLFLVLCRQLGLDAGMVAYSPSARPLGPVLKARTLGPLAVRAGMFQELRRKPTQVWACAVLVGGRAYLFEPGLGLPVPSPDGRGIATLEQAATDPRVLDQLQLAGRIYEPTRADLAANPVTILLESSIGTLSPRMKLLQRDLAGKNRMVLYRDPVEQAEAFTRALGPRCRGVELWGLPLSVEYRLFNPVPGMFVDRTQYALQFFQSKWPLLGARLSQLRGDLAEAIQQYVVFRFAESPVETDGKTKIPPPVQEILDLFATYYLALAQAEKGDASQARFLFGKTLEMLPEPGPTQPYFAMFRWGAATNLGLICAEAGEVALAIRYLTQETPTAQSHGNMLRARSLIFAHPFAPEPGVHAVIPPPRAPAGPQG